MDIKKVKEIATEIFDIAPLPSVQKERIEFMRDICLEKDKENIKQAKELDRLISENSYLKQQISKLHDEQTRLEKSHAEEIAELKKIIDKHNIPHDESSQDWREWNG